MHFQALTTSITLLSLASATLAVSSTPSPSDSLRLQRRTVYPRATPYNFNRASFPKIARRNPPTDADAVNMEGLSQAGKNEAHDEIIKKSAAAEAGTWKNHLIDHHNTNKHHLNSKQLAELKDQMKRHGAHTRRRRNLPDSVKIATLTPDEKASAHAEILKKSKAAHAANGNKADSNWHGHLTAYKEVNGKHMTDQQKAEIDAEIQRHSGHAHTRRTDLPDAVRIAKLTPDERASAHAEILKKSKAAHAANGNKADSNWHSHLTAHKTVNDKHMTDQQKAEIDAEIQRHSGHTHTRRGEDTYKVDLNIDATHRAILKQATAKDADKTYGKHLEEYYRVNHGSMGDGHKLAMQAQIQRHKNGARR